MLEYDDPEQKKEYIGGTEFNYEGYFEAWDTAFYAKAVLFIQCPSLLG